MMALSIETLMDDMYSKDISQKVRAAYITKFKAGDFAGWRVPYGYLRSSDNRYKLVVDEKTAPFVRTIYEMAAEKIPYAQIVNHLNDIKAETPIKFSNRANNGKVRDVPAVWHDYDVKNILKNQVYIGHMVQGKTKSKADAGNNEIYIVYNTHEAIIDNELWNKVQSVIDVRRERYANRRSRVGIQEDIVYRKLICAKCGKTIVRTCYYYKDKRTYTYECATRNAGHRHCKNVRQRADKLFDVILKTIQFQISLMADTEKLLMAAETKTFFQNKENEMKNQIKELTEKKKKAEYNKIKLYEDYRDGILNQQDYTKLTSAYEKDIEEIIVQLDALTTSYERGKTLKSQDNPCLKTFRKLKYAKKLTKEMVDALIDKIYVHDKYEIEIVFNFRNEYEYLMHAIQEVK